MKLPQSREPPYAYVVPQTAKTGRKGKAPKQLTFYRSRKGKTLEQLTFYCSRKGKALA